MASQLRSASSTVPANAACAKPRCCSGFAADTEKVFDLDESCAEGKNECLSAQEFRPTQEGKLQWEFEMTKGCAIGTFELVYYRDPLPSWTRSGTPANLSAATPLRPGETSKTQDLGEEFGRLGTRWGMRFRANTYYCPKGQPWTWGGRLIMREMVERSY